MVSEIAGLAAIALASLTEDEVLFLQNLPKAELHAHLNGSIPLSVLRHLANEYTARLGADVLTSEVVQHGLNALQNIELSEIADFFNLFPAIYALTSDTVSLKKATRAVLEEFLEGEQPNCAYLELRSTPRQVVGGMTRTEYVDAVLDEVERYKKDQAALILSLDRRMDSEAMREIVGIAILKKNQGRRVVGIDLCGDPLAGNMADLEPHLELARLNGLGITLHIAETKENSNDETLKLLSYKPARLGHATFLSEEARGIVTDNNICVEICLSSNLLCKTVSSLEDHHILYHLQRDHRVAICTDDILPFRNSLLSEYALLMAKAPLGLGLSRPEVQKIAQMSMDARF